MGRFASVLGSTLVPAAALLALAGCSSGHKSSAPPAGTTTSSTVGDTTTSESSAPTSTTVASTSTTTVAPVTTTTNRNGPRITGYTVSPASPVSCNAPTMIQLNWTATLATSVDLAIDGKQFATYPGGAQTQLEYLACDGKAHTYRLTAHAGSATTTVSKIVQTTST
jgi:hypothetical protein